MFTSKHNRQHGVTLIELLISITIGIIIMVAVIGAYIGASGAGRAAEAIGRMNEDGQAALTILSQQLRMAGVNPSQPDRNSVSLGLSARGSTVPLHNSVTNAYAILGCDLTFSNVTSGLVSTAGLTCGHAAASAGPDSISISYEADRYNTVPTGGGTPTDCIGSGITSSAANYLKSDGVTAVAVAIYEAENRFYIGTSTYVTNPTLYCKGNATVNAQPLVENIEDLQFTYGTVNTTATTSPIYVTVTPTFTTTLVLGYLKAYEVENTVASMPAATGATAARWNSVKTIRICVLVRSENPVADSIASASYLNCNGVLTTPTDRRLRRAYTTTVVLRNQ